MPPITVAQIDTIAAMSDPIERNYLITQTYSELSLEMAQRTGKTANWCSFATWASRQAGQSIRKEDIRNKIEVVLEEDQQLHEIVKWIGWFARNAGLKIPVEEIRATTIGKFVAGTIAKSADAVGRGNNKVFEEIGREFARFNQSCLQDSEFSPTSIAEFNNQLRDGDPPNGQEYLKKAFNRYYHSLFEPSAKKQTELRFLANVEIGFHEQTRLQPEIAASLNAAMVDPKLLLAELSSLFNENAGFWRGLFFSLQMLLSRSKLFKQKVDELAARLSSHMRRIITKELMTLTLPPSTCLELGKDLNAQYPADLLQLENADLLQFLLNIDPTSNSLSETGAIDWSDLKERLHYIADLFRCYHANEDLFMSPEVLKQAARIP